jgi:hypothetical protein
MRNNTEEIAQLDRQHIRQSILNIPATLIVGVGLAERFGSPGFLPPPFNSETAVTGMLVVGAALMIWGAVLTSRILRRRSALLQAQ